MRRRTLPLVIGAVGLVALAAIFGATRATAATSMHRGAESAQGTSAGCERLMSDPAAVKAMQPLHAEHVRDMQAWQERFGTDPSSAEAQAALKALRREHLRDMRSALTEQGIKVPAGLVCDPTMMDGTNGTGMMGGDTGTMMGGDTGAMMGGSAATGDIHEQHHGDGAGTATGQSTMMGGADTGTMMGGTY
jgi:hypothetical protein